MTTADPRAPLLEKLPSRPRLLAEVAYVIALVFLPSVLAGSGLGWVAFAILAICGVALVRPFADRRSLLAAALVVVGCGLMVALAAGGRPRARLGVMLERASNGVTVTRVLAGSPAAGKLRAKDRIESLDGTALPSALPVIAFARRVRLASAGTHVFGIERDGASEEIRVSLPPRPLRLGAIGWTGLFDLVLILVVVVLVWADGQGPAQLGLSRSSLGIDLGWGVLVCMGALVFDVMFSVPLGIIVRHTATGHGELTRRMGLYAGLSDQSSVWVLALSLVAAAAFEELIFRAYLLPRVRVLTGRWSIALVLVAITFGLGHLYAGRVAVVQATAIGIFFGLAYLWRGRLVPLIVAHAGFDGVMFALVMAIQHLHTLHPLGAQLH